MPEADPEDRHSVGGEGPYDPGSIRDCIGVTRPVRQKYSVRFFGQCCLGGRVGRNYSNLAIVLIEESQDVALDSVVVGDDMVARLRISPAVTLPGRNAGGEIQSLHRGARLERRPARFVWFDARANDSTHHSHRPQVSSETPGVNILNDRDLRCSQPSS